MTLVIGLLTGLVFGVGSAFAGRRWGTVLACVPIAGWFVAFGVVSHDGLQHSAVAPLCYGLFGVVVGVATGQILDRRRAERVPPHR